MFEPTTFPIATSSRPRMLDTSEVDDFRQPGPGGDDRGPDHPLGQAEHTPDFYRPGHGRVGTPR